MIPMSRHYIMKIIFMFLKTPNSLMYKLYHDAIQEEMRKNFETAEMKIITG